MPLPITLALVTDAFAGGFGATAAIVLIGGGVLLRWQRNRLQFQLMQTAIERGVTPMPGAPPLWLLSLRQGVMILVLGVGLLAAGFWAYHNAAGVMMPVISTTQPAMFGPLGRPLPRMDDDGPPDQFGPPDGPRGQGGPPGGGPGGRRPGLLGGGDGRGPMGPDGRPLPPRGGPMPALEQWHRAQDEKAVATVAMGSGLVLTLLGIVRVMFAFAERRYAGDAKGIA